MTMATTNDLLQNTDSNSTSASNAIDQMISMSILDHADPNNQNLDKSLLDQTDNARSFSPSRFRTIESLKRLSWKNTSPEQLARAEMKIFETLKSQFQGRYISVSNDTQKIWTIYSNLTSKNYPIVLIHGFGGGVGLWSLNLDQLCVDRPVYALDLPGFAHSSRPLFSTNPIEAEQQFVDMIEEWRKGIGLNEQFILLGHSFGGFLSAAYAIRHPTYIKQLVLIEPWGFGRKPEDWQTSRMQRIPALFRPISSVVMKFSPLSGLRIAGPFGVRMMKYFRSDLRVKFEKLFDDDRILVYIYHCNAQIPTGEQGFRTISDFFAWAKEPMTDRIHLIDENIPIYFLHGEQSWIDIEPAIIAQTKHKNVYIDTVQEAGHHVYADAPVEFDMYLKKILMNKN